MKIKSAQFVKSAPSLADVPDFENAPEIALVGRSNVGKSSFINTMLNRKKLAQTSNTPGKTRLINLYDVMTEKGRLIFADLPGYGYAKVSKTEQARWQKRLEEYLTRREPMKLVILLMDARHGMQENDSQMIAWLAHHRIPTLPVLTKCDKISKNAVTAIRKRTADALGQPPEAVIPFSATGGLGKDACWRILADVIGDR